MQVHALLHNGAILLLAKNLRSFATDTQRPHRSLDVSPFLGWLQTGT